jgi:arylsulfatase A-like enzyme
MSTNQMGVFVMNLICVCLDTFRADLVGKNKKFNFVQTPNLDNFMRQSVSFDQAFGECQPTLQMRRAFFTGRRSFPFRFNFDRRGLYHHAAGWHKIPPDQDTLAEILLARGYMTGLISDTYHMFKPTMNYTRGFVTYDFIRGQEIDNWRGCNFEKIRERLERHSAHPKAMILNEYLLQYLFNTQDRNNEEDYFCAKVFSQGAKWLEENKNNKPFFLWLDSFDPHEPWDPPTEYADYYCPDYDGKDYIFGNPPVNASKKELERIKALYFGEVTLVDKWLGYFLDKLDELGLRQETIVMILSDHGTQLLDHGRFHKGQDELHPFNTQIIWSIRHPDGPTDEHFTTFVQSHDVMPTILHLLDIPYANAEGENVWQLVTHEKEQIRDHVVIGWCGSTGYNFSSGPAQGRVSVRDKEWNYICAVGGEDQKAELYNYATDTDEKNNIVSEYPDIVKLERKRVEAVLGQPLPGRMTEFCDDGPSPILEYIRRRYH